MTPLSYLLQIEIEMFFEELFRFLGDSLKFADQPIFFSESSDEFEQFRIFFGNPIVCQFFDSPGFTSPYNALFFCHN